MPDDPDHSLFEPRQWRVGDRAGIVRKAFPVVESWYGFPTGPTDFSVFRPNCRG